MMDAKIEKAIELWQRRESQFEEKIIAWAGRILPADQANELIEMVRSSHSAVDVRNELNALAATLTQPTTTN